MADLEIKKENIISTGNMKLFLCHFCNECYSQERSFKLHYRAHKKFTCEKCEKVFSLKRELTIHLRSHETSKKVYACEICHKVVQNKEKLKIHQRTHKSEKLHVCDVCNSTFKSKVALKKHYCTHTAQEPYVCDICQASFPENSSLQAHAFTHITEETGNSSKATNDSKEGKIVKDSKEGNYQRGTQKNYGQHVCDICQKTFKSKSFLKSHHRIHEGGKSHVSNISERAFSELSSSNTSHNRTIEKPHVCGRCQKAFSRKSSLMSHGCSRKGDH